jgi:hypothetical protein
MNNNAHDVAAHFKALGIGRQESWSRWVQWTQLRPGMNAKDWYKIYDSVSPMLMQMAARPSMGEPTHRITYHYGSPTKVVRVTRKTNLFVEWIDEDGYTGSDLLDSIALEELTEETGQ